MPVTFKEILSVRTKILWVCVHKDCVIFMKCKPKYMEWCEWNLNYPNAWYPILELERREGSRQIDEISNWWVSLTELHTKF